MFNVIDKKDRRICFRYFLIIIDMKGDFIDLEKFLPTEERVQSPNELRIKQAAAPILNRCAGAISMVCLMEEADMNATNYLVEDRLLQHIDALSEVRMILIQKVTSNLHLTKWVCYLSEMGNSNSGVDGFQVRIGVNLDSY